MLLQFVDTDVTVVNKRIQFYFNPRNQLHSTLKCGGQVNGHIRMRGMGCRACQGCQACQNFVKLVKVGNCQTCSVGARKILETLSYNALKYGECGVWSLDNVM